MPEQVGDLLKSKATLWIAPSATALPDEGLAVGTAWGGAWVKMGWTIDPVKMLYEFSEAELVADQVLGPLGRRKTDEHVTIETTLAEPTALNLAYATGMTTSSVVTTAAGATQVGYEQLVVGNAPVPTVWSVGFEGINYKEGASALPVRVFIRRATLMINGELEFSQKSDGQTAIPLQIKALADTANSNEMFMWQRVTAPATS